MVIVFPDRPGADRRVSYNKMNISIFNPGEECVNWCINQHMTHASNVSIYNMFFLIAALVFMMIYELIPYIVIENATERQKNNISNFCFYSAEMCIVSYFVITFWG